VAGIVRDTYNGRLDEQPTLIVYVPFWVRPPHGASLVFRTVEATQPLIRSVQRAIWSIDPALPVSEVHALSEIVSAATAQRRFQMQLAVAFGVAALFLALIGTYGIVSYNVEQRRGELGLRLALGARPAGLAPLIMKYGLIPVLWGLACGVLLSLAVGGLVRNFVFGVSATDPLILSGVSVALIFAAALACLLPASRVMRLEPWAILRHD
jgi:hypothetical protein